MQSTKNQENNKAEWTHERHLAFKKLSTALASRPILKTPDFNKEFVLRTDASEINVGAVLMLGHDEILHPVAYASKQLLPRETRYSTIEREGLPLVWVVQRFHSRLPLWQALHCTNWPSAVRVSTESEVFEQQSTPLEPVVTRVHVHF